MSLRGAQRATWQSPGREDLLAYTTTPNTCPRWLTAEKSPAVETKTTVHDYKKTPARAGSAPVSRRNDRFRFREIPTVTSFPRNDKLLGRVRRLITFIRFYPKRTPVPPCHCEERNARRGNLPEGKTYLRTRLPEYSPAGAPRREVPRNRNENNRTRPQKNTRPRRICVLTVETVRHIHAPARLPAAARHREIPRGRDENNRTRLPRILARRGSLSCQRWLRAERERHTNRNYPCGTVYIFPKVCYNTENATAKTENATAKTEKAQNNGNEKPPTKGAGQRKKQRGGDRPSAADVEIRAIVG